MRLIITAIVCSLLTVGGFFGFKQYQRSEMKQDARAFVLTTVQRNAQDFSGAAETQIAELIDRFVDEVFRVHYQSGGLTQPAEFDEVNFSRELFERIRDEAQRSSVSEETKEFATLLYAQTRPLQRGGLGGVGGGLPPDDDVSGDGDAGG